MAEINNNTQSPSAEFKEACCIDAGRVYDSCCDRDCLEDLRCYFTAEDQQTIESALSLRIKNAEVANVYVDVEPVSFNRGFYSCDLTFFFIIEFDVYTAPKTCPQTIYGITCYEKKVILYGSEGNVKTFSNIGTLEEEIEGNCTQTSNHPRCSVQCVDPIALAAKICEKRDYYECLGCVPTAIQSRLGGTIVTDLPAGTPVVYVTLGLFSIVQLIRNVQMLIPVYDFCIPEKQCSNMSDEPCDAFRRIKFPTDDFFPPRPNNIDGGNCCCTPPCAGVAVEHSNDRQPDCCGSDARDGAPTNDRPRPGRNPHTDGGR